MLYNEKRGQTLPALSSDISHKIINILCKLGITANYAGFYYTIYAVTLALENPERLQLVTKWLYPDIAARCRSGISSIDKNIRTVCTRAWHCNEPLLSEMAGHRLDKKPSSAEFLAIITVYIMQKPAGLSV